MASAEQINLIARKRAAQAQSALGRGARNRARGVGGLMSGHAGTLVKNAVFSRMPETAAVPEPGENASDAEKAAYSKAKLGQMGQEFANNFVAATAGNAAELVSGFGNAAGAAGAAGQAANMAGALQDAKNSHERDRLTGEAGRQADAMNLQNTARTAAMTDSATANRSAFDMGMQGIDMSGIEGSANMERNLQYGKSRAEAEQQLQYEMMNQEAQNLGDSMVNSFSDLSQMRVGAEQGAFNDYMNQWSAGQTAQWDAQVQADARFTMEDLANQAALEEEGAALQGAEDAAGQAENYGYYPDADELAAANAGSLKMLAVNEAGVERNIENGNTGVQAAGTAAAGTAAAGGPLANMSYDELVALRDRYKGGSKERFIPGGSFEGYDMDEVQNTIDLLLKDKTRHGAGRTLPGYGVR